ncbi:BppU family phage baseplate upper protein [Pseudoruminococcus massiliensis]|uniref:BppU family phage baseplate upper protein n=1 Tax=Pseudoruminococcus massiliensis TaxID=2086583 RepID=UPI0022E0901C|nr:BppU family phage baseplate upper protein [Pseudoruminococcus massiliensis]
MQIPHYNIVLDVNLKAYQAATIIARVGDKKSRYIDIELRAGNERILLNKERVTLTVADENETIALTDCTISNNIITAELTENMVAKSGKLKAEITVYGTNKEVITAVQFGIDIVGKLSTEVVERENDFSALQAALSDVASTSNRINEVSSRIQPIALGGTGAAKAYEATQNIKSLYLGAITTLPTGSNLDDYTTDGTYDIGASVSADIKNAPVAGSTYKLIVMHIVASSLTQQIAIVPGKNSLFMRNCSSGTWSAWTKIVSYSPQIDEVGTWNPVLDGNGTITVKNADYVYNGNTIMITVTITAGSDITGTSLTVTGLPIIAKRAVAATAYINGSSASVASINGTGILVKSDSSLANKSITVTGTYLV